MTSFTLKKISNPLSVSEKLHQARTKKNVSLKEVAKRINVSVKYLESIESGNYSQLPGDVYARNFLKAYIKFLCLDKAELLEQFSSEQNIYTKTSSGKDFKKPVARVSRMNLLVAPKVLRGIIVFLLALTVLGYLGVKIKAIVAPPFLTIEYPVDNIKIDTSFIEILGQTESETILSINGQQVFIDDQGKFTELIDLRSGVNIIEITAKKRHGKETKIYRQVVVEEIVDPASVTSEENENKIDPSATAAP